MSIVIASVPPTIFVDRDEGAEVSFTIPEGIYTSGTWTLEADWPHQGWPVVADDSNAHGTHFSSHPGGGTYTETVAVTEEQLAIINTTAGTTTLWGLSCNQHKDYTVNSLVLTLEGCAYLLNPTGAHYGAEGGEGTFNVLTQTPCPWTPTSEDPSWLHVLHPNTGTGTGEVVYSVDAQEAESADRIGHILVDDLVFTVTQDGIVSVPPPVEVTTGPPLTLPLIPREMFPANNRYRGTAESLKLVTPFTVVIEDIATLASIFRHSSVDLTTSATQYAATLSDLFANLQRQRIQIAWRTQTTNT